MDGFTARVEQGQHYSLLSAHLLCKLSRSTHDAHHAAAHEVSDFCTANELLCPGELGNHVYQRWVLERENLCVHGVIVGVGGHVVTCRWSQGADVKVLSSVEG